MNMLEGLMDKDWFNGSTAMRAVPMPEQNRFSEHFKLKKNVSADEYCRAISDYLNDRINEVTMWSILGR